MHKQNLNQIGGQGGKISSGIMNQLTDIMTTEKHPDRQMDGHMDGQPKGKNNTAPLLSGWVLPFKSNSYKSILCRHCLKLSI